MWDSGYSWDEILYYDGFKTKTYVAYFTVLEKIEVEEGLDYSGYSVRIDKCLFGNLEEGVVINVYHLGGYDKEAGSYSMLLGPWMTPPRAGEKWVTHLAHIRKPTDPLSGAFWGGGYVEEIDGTEYVVFRSVIDKPASGLSKYLPEDQYLLTSLDEDHQYYNTNVEYLNEIIIVQPEAIDRLFQERFTEIYEGVE